MGIVIASEVDSIFVVDGKSPGSHFRGERPVELPDGSGIWIDSEEKERGIILSKGEVKGIPISRFPWTGISPPADRFPDWGPEISEGKGEVVIQGKSDESKKGKKRSDKEVIHKRWV